MQNLHKYKLYNKLTYADFYIESVNDKLKFNGNVKFHFGEQNFLFSNENPLDGSITGRLMEINNFHFLVKKINDWLLLSNVEDILDLPSNIKMSVPEYKEKILNRHFSGAFIAWLMSI